MRGSFRLTDAVAALRLFGGRLPAGSGSAARFAAAGTPAPRATEGWSEASVRSVLDPLARTAGPGRVGSPRRLLLPFREVDGVRTTPAPARQVDRTTCGSAVLTMLAMSGAPRLAAWVAADPAPRFAALQLRAHRATSRAGLLPWPQALGTPPWAAAVVARYGDVRYTHRVVGRGPRAAAVLRAAVAATASGTPVPLFSGGDVSGGWQAAVPRHVVLLTTADAETVGVYEPGSATIHTVPVAVLFTADDAAPADRALLTAALGGWPHPVWAILSV